MNSAQDILSTYVHFRCDDRADTLPVSAAFWSELASGKREELNQGRLMTAFTFAEPWSSWERHPAGEELVMLLSGAAMMVLDEPAGEREVELNHPGAYLLVPQNVWHRAKTSVSSTLLFLTPGAGTEHRAVAA
ncbi:MAG: WxcM-like domain-containing protein [Proteobacteria bacterium]|nr:WxcM-like domain-containing protein [Pseudomonadota bacterium]